MLRLLPLHPWTAVPRDPAPPAGLLKTRMGNRGWKYWSTVQIPISIMQWGVTQIPPTPWTLSPLQSPDQSADWSTGSRAIWPRDTYLEANTTWTGHARNWIWTEPETISLAVSQPYAFTDSSLGGVLLNESSWFGICCLFSEKTLI